MVTKAKELIERIHLLLLGSFGTLMVLRLSGFDGLEGYIYSVMGLMLVSVSLSLIFSRLSPQEPRVS
ncbi:hypothetical protein GCM10010990_20010 [Croceicoccus mobilis]|uniref:Uncharacterized protein n=1 Tax=Croceicoccus mobilis TaxID=1703339 RepID=A0A916Z2F8_9SPHN|nr:hypothetical protein GCM10010990_20010 [Croceicoccus mobilis]